MEKEVKVWDETLRDGEQMPGVVFSLKEKLQLAEKSSEFGCNIISTMPSISKSEIELTEKLASGKFKSKITATSMLTKSSVDLVKSCGAPTIFLFIPVSDIHIKYKLKTTREQNLNKSRKYVDYANSLGLKVIFGAEDASRADTKYLINFINTLSQNIEYFIPADTLGFLTPKQTYKFIKKIKKETDSRIGMHVHNDFGQATANTLAGIEAGADLFAGTFTGIGERAGNTSLEEVIMSLKIQYRQNLPVNYKMIYEICNLVQEYSGAKLQKHKPISGENAFAHESGIHIDGLLKDSRTYENFDPKIIGRKREFLYGKQSGKNSLKHILEEYLGTEKISHLLDIVKQHSIREKKAYTAEEVITKLNQ